MAAVMGSAGGCGLEKQEWKQQTEELLLEKYGEEFQVSSIGKSYGNLGNDTYTALCSPISDEECLFLAEVEKNGQYFQDGYISELVSRQIEEALEEELERSGKNCFVHAAPGSKYVDSSDTGLTLKEFLELNPKNRFAVYVAVQGTVKEEEETKEAISWALSLLEPLNGSLRLSFLSQEDLAAVRERMKEIGRTDSRFMELLSKGEEKTFSLEEGRLFP